MIDDKPKTLYGAAIGLFKGDEVILSRRIDTPKFPKKWQFCNGRLRGQEQSQDAAIRIVKEQTGIQLDKKQLHYINSISLAESHEFYYVYLVHLKDDEKPTNTDTKYRSNWRQFKLGNACVLDLVPGIRNILRKLLSCLIKVREMEAKENDFAHIKAEANAIYDEQQKREEAICDYGGPEQRPAQGLNSLEQAEFGVGWGAFGAWVFFLIQPKSVIFPKKTQGLPKT